MRATCARVLAAALMTGAIAFVLAMPAFVGVANDVGRSLTAPPSFLQRPVNVVASALSRPEPAASLNGMHRAQPTIPPAGVRPGSSQPGGTLASSRHSTTAGHSKPDPKPGPAPPKPAPAPPKPAPTPDTRDLAGSGAAVTSPPTPTQPAASSDEDTRGKGKGKAKGRDKDKGRAPKAEQPPAPATTPLPPVEAPAAQEESQHDQDKDKGKGHDKGRDK